MKKSFLMLFLALTITSYPQSIRYFTVEIDSGTAISDSIDLGDSFSDANLKLIAVVMDSAWTTANLTFQSWRPTGTSGGTWCNVYQYDGTELKYTAATNRWIIAKPTDFAGIRYLKIRSGTAATPVTQVCVSSNYPRKLRLVLRQY